AEIAVIGSGLVDARWAIAVAGVFEIVLVVVAGRQILVAVRRFRAGRAAELDLWRAIEDGLAVVLPRPVARLVALEPCLWSSLAIWLFRRHAPGPDEFSYRKRSIVAALVTILAVTTPVELLLVELLIPWAWLRWILLIAGIYALIWTFAYYASLVVLPHRLAETGLELHYGFLASVTVPYADLEQVELAPRRSPTGTEEL